ncbi:hypothetical protein [Mesonia mobilis]|uniref:hypothetical protein n=1 Tax=Mesonia mobilis TaxID=369791 RepID=UPI0026F057C5|nr:hypothetical protein [Mesonia mobilis]
MSTIYDDIRKEFSEKLSTEKYINSITKNKLERKTLELGLEVLIDQIRDIRRNNQQETPQKINSDANALINSIDRNIK